MRASDTASPMQSGKRVAVLQSNYIPWKGYFDIIHDVDTFLFYDEVQFTKNDWRNRNKIRTPNGLKWLSIPVGQNIDRTIDAVEIPDAKWQRSHWDILRDNYRKAPYFSLYKDFMEYAYLERRWDRLIDINRYLIIEISQRFLGVQTRFEDSREYPSSGTGHQKLLSLLKATGASSYLSGPAAKDYIIAQDYADAGIDLRWKDYSGYPAYPQQFDYPFEHGVSILDLFFNTGGDAPYYIWGWREDKGSGGDL